jgi:hypothetical protein
MSAASYYCQKHTNYSRTISYSQQQQLATISDDDKITGSSTHLIEKLGGTNYRSWGQQLSGYSMKESFGCSDETQAGATAPTQVACINIIARKL